MSDYNQNPSSGYYAPQNSTMAIVSLVAGILGWTMVPFLGSIVAVVTGHMAKREIRESGGRLGGDGMATAGLVLGYIMLVVGLLGICATIFFFLLFPLIFGVAAWQSSFVPLTLLVL